LGNHKGLFIVLEGIDGSGKSTQARRLVSKLAKLGKKSLLLHEPGGTALGENISELVKHSTQINIGPLAETLLFAAARAQLVEEVIRPALSAGTIVVCDRFTPSTEAYQGHGRGVPEDLIEVATKYAVGDIVPDVVIWLDVDIEVGLTRKIGPRLPGVTDRFEDEVSSFHSKVRQGYVIKSKESPDQWVKIDGSRSVEEVEEDIWSVVDSLLAKHKYFKSIKKETTKE